MMTKKPFAVITSLYSSSGSNLHRLENYHIFIKKMNLVQVPVFTIELAIGDNDFFLQPNSYIKQIRTKDIIYQKERLLNILIEQIADDFEYLAWIDCDLFYENDNWPERTLNLLAQNDFVQLFQKIIYLPQEDSKFQGRSDRDSISAAYFSAINGDQQKSTDLRPFPKSMPGGAWAGKSKMLKHYKLYDTSVIGFNDALFARAVFDVLHNLNRLLPPKMYDHFLEWKDNLTKHPLRTTYLDETIFHLWHPTLWLRRHKSLLWFDYDPTVDVGKDENGCWKWCSDKTKLHKCVKDFCKNI